MAGQYLQDGNQCLSCSVGTFQNSPFHKEVTCKNCSSECDFLLWGNISFIDYFFIRMTLDGFKSYWISETISFQLLCVIYIHRWSHNRKYNRGNRKSNNGTMRSVYYSVKIFFGRPWFCDVSMSSESSANVILMSLCCHHMKWLF